MTAWFVHEHIHSKSYNVSCQEPREGWVTVASATSLNGAMALRAWFAGEREERKAKFENVLKLIRRQ